MTTTRQHTLHHARHELEQTVATQTAALEQATNDNDQARDELTRTTRELAAVSNALALELLTDNILQGWTHKELTTLAERIGYDHSKSKPLIAKARDIAAHRQTAKQHTDDIITTALAEYPSNLPAARPIIINAAHHASGSASWFTREQATA